jgi:hypothetical protein
MVLDPLTRPLIERLGTLGMHATRDQAEEARGGQQNERTTYLLARQLL